MSELNRSMYRGVLTFVVAATVWLPVMPATALAAAARPDRSLKLTTSPLPIELEAKPGQTVTTSIKVKQSDGVPETLQANLLKFGAYGTSGQPALADRGPGDDYFDWVKFDAKQFTVASDVWHTVQMTITIPKSAAFEYNYAVVFSRVGDQVSPGNNSTGVAGGTAVLVLMNVDAPGMKRSLQITSFGVAHKVVEFLPTTFTVNFHNNGNVYARPGGTIFITQGKNEVGEVAVNATLGNVLAHSNRVMNVDWADGFPHYSLQYTNGKAKLDRHGKQINILNWNIPPAVSSSGDVTNVDPVATRESSNPLSRIRFGQYTADLVAIYTDNYGRDVPIESKVTFWVIPWRLLIVVLLILIVFGFAGYSLVQNVLRRRRRRQRLREKHRLR